MALQTSGTISLNDIHQEAGGTSGTTAAINDTDIRALIGKTGSTTMSFNEWYGAALINFNAGTISRIAIAAISTASINFRTDGTITTVGSGYTNIGWTSTSTGVGNDYEIRATVTNGTLSGGTSGSWLALSSNRQWSKIDNTQDDGPASVTLTFEIRKTGTTTVLDSESITLSADANSLN